MIKRLSTINLAARIVIGVAVVIALLAAYGGWQLVAWLTATGNDTWVFESSSGWTDRTSNPAPSIRTGAAMAYDPSQQAVVLFGGRSSSNPESLDDTWTWDGRVWHIAGQGAHPPGLAAAAMAYDPLGKRMILFGGQATLQARYIAPPPGCQVTTSGGQKVAPPSSCSVSPGEQASSPESAETWAYSTGGWTKLAPSHQPPPREGAALAFDAASGRMILFGGSTQPQAGGGPENMLGDTWALQGGDWWLLTPAGAPSPRAYPGFAETPAGPVLYGGTAGAELAGTGDGQGLGDTWRWTGIGWEKLAPAHSPGRRYASGMASSGAGGVVLFGGQLGCGADHSARGCSVSPYLDDTWKWDGRDWHPADQRLLTAKPRGRSGASMAYFGPTGAVILFGGQDPHLLSLL